MRAFVPQDLRQPPTGGNLIRRENEKTYISCVDRCCGPLGRISGLRTNAWRRARGNWAIPIGVGLGMGLAAGLAGLGQGKVAGSVAEALARNPGARAGIQLALFIGLAFIESLVLFTFVLLFLRTQ